MVFNPCPIEGYKGQVVMDSVILFIFRNERSLDDNDNYEQVCVQVAQKRTLQSSLDDNGNYEQVCVQVAQKRTLQRYSFEGLTSC